MSDKCYNCNRTKTVSVVVPCPDCRGNGILETDALREFADAMEIAFRKRTRVPDKHIELLRRIRLSQGYKKWELYGTAE